MGDKGRPVRCAGARLNHRGTKGAKDTKHERREGHDVGCKATDFRLPNSDFCILSPSDGSCQSDPRKPTFGVIGMCYTTSTSLGGDMPRISVFRAPVSLVTGLLSATRAEVNLVRRSRRQIRTPVQTRERQMAHGSPRFPGVYSPPASHH